MLKAIETKKDINSRSVVGDKDSFNFWQVIIIVFVALKYNSLHCTLCKHFTYDEYIKYRDFTYHDDSLCA